MLHPRRQHIAERRCHRIRAARALLTKEITGNYGDTSQNSSAATYHATSCSWLGFLVSPYLICRTTPRKGNGRVQTFFGNEGYASYVGLLAEASIRWRVGVMSWWLTPNHAQLHPRLPDIAGLSRMRAEVSRKHARRIHQRLKRTWNQPPGDARRCGHKHEQPRKTDAQPITACRSHPPGCRPGASCPVRATYSV